jgi:hypothetical protein
VYPSHMLYETGWGKAEPGWINYTTGRAIGALVEYYHATKDMLAIDLAKRLADANMAKTFTPEGKLTKAAGYHLHSSEGTMAGLLYLGVAANDKRYLDFGRKLYDVGLRPWRTSWGWAKESTGTSPGRGEANNTGDFIEAALALAEHADPAYYADAERFIRNGLLAAQVVNTDWIRQFDKADSHDYAYTNIRKRARGAFAFTTPNGYHSYNTDLMGGALRALCKAYQASVQAQSGATRINLLFTWDDPVLAIRSKLPEDGRVDIQSKRACRLSLRLPDGVARRDVNVRVNGEGRTPAWKGTALLIGELPDKANVVVCFDQPRRHTTERAPRWNPHYQVDWTGETIVAMSPSQGPIALY